MTRDEHLCYFARLHILEKLLSTNDKLLLSALFIDIVHIYFVLIQSKIDFDVNTLSYDTIINSSDVNIKKLNKLFSKRRLIGLLAWIKKIYFFEHTIISKYNDLNAVFSNKDLTLSVQKDNLICFFKIERGLFAYLSYSVDSEIFLVQDEILFKPATLNIFVSNLSDYYFMNKDLLKMVFYS